MSLQADSHGEAAPCLLSFDVEEYFQVEAAASVVRGDEWGSLPKRLAPSVERILQLLADYERSATFFVLGWVARHEPELVRRIAEMGHEVASHGMSHEMLSRLTPEGFRRELGESRRRLEDLSGQRVVGYRAPTFSLVGRTAWALDVLADEGFTYDSSVFPIRHDRYGVPEAPAGVHWAVGPGGGRVLEIPPLTMRLLGANWPVGGGGYLRLLPVRVVDIGLGRARRRGEATMLYLHPWEFDPDQPVLPMGLRGRWRHRVGLRRTEGKLRWLLRRHGFVSVGAALERLTARAEVTYQYG